ncbi:hypothetical protein BAC3_01660 [uncultured bacterium]|nr:hypothetical protein BAC3_01660 [uncultured bacterium]
MSYLPSSPDLNTLESILKKYPRRGVLLFKLLEDMDGSYSPFTKEMRELFMTYISALNHCDFCYNAHKTKFSTLGHHEVIVEQLKTDINSASVDEKLKPILHLIKKLTLNPKEISAKDAQSIYDAGWNEQAFLDAVCITSIVNCMNRFVMGIGAGGSG